MSSLPMGCHGSSPSTRTHAVGVSTTNGRGPSIRRPSFLAQRRCAKPVKLQLQSAALKLVQKAAKQTRPQRESSRGNWQPLRKSSLTAKKRELPKERSHLRRPQNLTTVTSSKTPLRARTSRRAARRSGSRRLTIGKASWQHAGRSSKRSSHLLPRLRQSRPSRSATPRLQISPCSCSPPRALKSSSKRKLRRPSGTATHSQDCWHRSGRNRLQKTRPKSSSTSTPPRKLSSSTSTVGKLTRSPGSTANQLRFATTGWTRHSLQNSGWKKRDGLEAQSL